jgi:hypothetical protein
MNAEAVTLDEDRLPRRTPIRFITGTLEALAVGESRVVIGIGAKKRTFALATDFLVDECVAARANAAVRPLFGQPRVRVAFWIDRASRHPHTRYVARALSVESV